MRKFILAVETSVKNGSLAVFENDGEIDGWIGNENISRSEDLLPEIEKLLSRNNIGLNELEMIAVSTGPGSFTGLRVGIATAKALSFALGCSLVGVSVLESLANLAADGEIVISVAATGRGIYFWQIFEHKSNLAVVSEIETGNAVQLAAELKKQTFSKIIFEPTALKSYAPERYSGKPEITTADENIARLIARRSRLIAGSEFEPGAAVLPFYGRGR